MKINLKSGIIHPIMVKASRNFPNREATYRPRREFDGTSPTVKFEPVVIGQEDFSGLLESIWDGRDIDGSGTNRGGQSYSAFGMGLEAKAAGKLDTSYDKFLFVLECEDVYLKMKFLAIKNLADIAYQQSRSGEKDPAKRIYWLKTALDFFQELDGLGWGEEPSGSKLHTAVQFSKVAFDHQSLIDDQEEKERLLGAAYSRLDIVREIITPFKRDNWEFMLHASMHKIARRMSVLTRGDIEYKWWLQAWQTEAENVLNIVKKPANSQNGEIKRFYLKSQAQALAILRQEEKDPEIKLGYEIKSYELLEELFPLEKITNENILYVLRRMEMAAGLAIQIAERVPGLKRNLWLQKAYDINKRIIDIGITDVNRRGQNVVVKAIKGIISNGSSDDKTWTARKLEELDAHADLMLSGGDTFRAISLYSAAVKAIDQLMTGTLGQERTVLLQKIRDMHSIIARLNKEESGNASDAVIKRRLLSRASVNYSFAAKDAKELCLYFGNGEGFETNALMFHDFMIESARTAFLAGDFKYAYQGYRLAADVSEEFCESKPENKDKLLWFQRLYEEMMRAAAIAFLMDDNINAALSLGMAGRIAQRCSSEFMLNSGEWLEKARGNYQRAGECWDDAGSPENANMSFTVASGIHV